MLRRYPAEPWFRRRERPNWRLGVPGGRLGGQGQRQGRRFSLGSGGSPGYDSDLRSDKWEIPVNSLLKAFHTPFRVFAAPVPAAVNYAFGADISPMTQLPCSI